MFVHPHIRAFRSSHDFSLARTPRANHVHSVSGLVFTNQYSASRSTRSFSLFPFGEVRYVLFSTIGPSSCSFYLPWSFAFAYLPRFSPTSDKFTNENVRTRSVIPFLFSLVILFFAFTTRILSSKTKIIHFSFRLACYRSTTATSLRTNLYKVVFIHNCRFILF